MAKDPAFLFYPGDFNTGTQFFTDEQVGKYMRLLMAQHQHGHLTEKQVIHICNSYDKDIMLKFKKDSAGLWYNERLEIEVKKRKEYSKSRSENRTKRDSPKKKSSTYVPHMENENRNENRNTDGSDFEQKFLIAFDERTCENYKMTFKGLDLAQELQEFKIKCDNDPQSYHNRDSAGLRTAFQYQLKNSKPKKNGSVIDKFAEVQRILAKEQGNI